MSGTYKHIGQVARERGIPAKLIRGAIKRRQLKAVRPGSGGTGWFYVFDADVDKWLKGCAAW